MWGSNDHFGDFFNGDDFAPRNNLEEIIGQFESFGNSVGFGKNEDFGGGNMFGMFGGNGGMFNQNQPSGGQRPDNHR